MDDLNHLTQSATKNPEIKSNKDIALYWLS